MSDNAGTNTLTEMEKKIRATSLDSICGVFDYVCNERCGYERNCRNRVENGKSTAEKIKTVKDFKEKLWKDPESYEVQLKKALSAKDCRSVSLIVDLFEMKSSETGKINYHIGYDKFRHKQRILFY